MADLKRQDAAFQWVVNFYGAEVELPPVKKVDDLWKEHILSLAYLCKTKVARRHTASSAQEAYEKAKSVIQCQEQQYGLQRWKELDAAAAAKGDKTAIYKFLVLLFHIISSIVDDYITESQNFLDKNNLSRPFADLLHDVNHITNTGWWQGQGSSFVVPSPVATALTSSPAAENTSFGKYSANDVPSTPRTPFMKNSRVPVTHLSPIQTAINSPVTLKIKQEEYKRTRDRVVELEHLAELGRMEAESAQKETARQKEIARQWREKYEEAENGRKTLSEEIIELVNNIDELKRKNDQAISHGRELQTRYEKARTELVQLSEEGNQWLQQRDYMEGTKNELERVVRDMTEEITCLNDKCTSLQSLYAQSTTSNDKLARVMTEKSAEVEFIRADQRKALQEKDRQCDEYIMQVSDLSLKLSNAHSQSKELAEKLAERDAELNEARESFNRERSNTQQTHKRQIELLEGINAKLQTHLDEANQRIAEKDAVIEEEREKLMSSLDDSEKQLSARSELRKELDRVNIELRDQRIKFTMMNKMHLESETARDELERKLQDRSLEVRAAYERMEALEKEFDQLRSVKTEEQNDSILLCQPIEGHLEHIKESSELIKDVGETVSSQIVDSADQPPAELELEPSETEDDLQHLNFDLGDEDDCVMVSKSVFGEDYKKTFDENRQFENTVDRDRIEELQRRNSVLPPALRASYAAEVSSYNSPSGNEENIKKKKPEIVEFKIPLTPGARSLSKTSLDDKENKPSSISKGGSTSRRKSFAKAFGFGKKVDKH